MPCRPTTTRRLAAAVTGGIARAGTSGFAGARGAGELRCGRRAAAAWELSGLFRGPSLRIGAPRRHLSAEAGELRERSDADHLHVAPRPTLAHVHAYRDPLPELADVADQADQ